MARQVGDIKIVGTVEDLCFYKMEGAFFVRMKSSLTGKRFWKDKVFAGSRRSAGLLGRASSLASKLYKRLPEEKQGRNVFQALTGGVKRQLKEGRTEEQIEVWFVQAYLPPPETVVETKGAEKKCFVRLITASTRGQRHPSFVQLPPLVKVRHADRRKQGRKLFRLVRERGSPKGGEMQQTASKTEQAFKTCLVCKKSI